MGIILNDMFHDLTAMSPSMTSFQAGEFSYLGQIWHLYAFIAIPKVKRLGLPLCHLILVTWSCWVDEFGLLILKQVQHDTSGSLMLTKRPFAISGGVHTYAYLFFSPSPSLSPSPSPSLPLSPPLSLSPPRPLALSPSRPLALSPSRPLALSPSRPLALSPSRPLALSPSRPLALSPSRPLAPSPPRPSRPSRPSRPFALALALALPPSPLPRSLSLSYTHIYILIYIYIIYIYTYKLIYRFDMNYVYNIPKVSHLNTHIFWQGT